MTAEDAKAFKPSADIFRLAMSKLGCPAHHILHFSLAQFADLEGAMPLGIKVAWIKRGREALGRFTPQPMFDFPTLDGLAAEFSA